jgi:hydroxyacylglutathione hydrolase
VTVGTVPLLDGEHIESGVGAVTVMHVPGHTLGAVAYVIDGGVFTGDTLFGGGCGRLFEGTAPQMHASLTRLAALPGDYLLYSGHEYTLQNLAFAAVVEPNNLAVARRIEAVRALRAAGNPSVPSTIEEERATNPFLRCDSEGFASLRKQKDEFRA